MTVDHDMQHQPDIRQMVIDKEKQKTYVGPFWWHIWANFGSHTFFSGVSHFSLLIVGNHDAKNQNQT